jgi:hypothetical protein
MRLTGAEIGMSGLAMTRRLIGDTYTGGHVHGDSCTGSNLHIFNECQVWNAVAEDMAKHGGARLTSRPVAPDVGSEGATTFSLTLPFMLRHNRIDML